jgi:hypothetical protein
MTTCSVVPPFGTAHWPRAVSSTHALLDRLQSIPPIRSKIGLFSEGEKCRPPVVYIVVDDSKGLPSRRGEVQAVVLTLGHDPI